MPTIQVKKKDLEELIGRPLAMPDLARRLPWVKGEIKDYDEANGEFKLELNDTNRPDLWCVEGVARQIRMQWDKKAASYPFYESRRKPAGVVEVATSVKTIRPYMGACIARGLSIREETLTQLIQTQEKLSESFGRKRQLVSIGLYRPAQFEFPVYYKAVDPSEIRFVPLGSDSAMTPAGILKSHPKGIAYASILSPHREVPILADRENRVLSFPPIINSREIGEVKVGDRDLFVEVTGTDLRMVILTVNILAANLADRGARIEPVEVRYPYPTDFGRKIVMPCVLGPPMEISADEFEAALGEKVPVADLVRALKRYGYRVKGRRRRLSVSVFPYRDDLLHPVDVVEDFAISRGYDSFVPEMPSESTVGGLSPQEEYSDRVRETMIGMGFQEMISNILTSREDLRDRMNLPPHSKDDDLIGVENPMARTFSALRSSLIPSLLRVEAASSKSFYPHRIFEVGETAVRDEGAEEGTRTILKLGALIAHPAANFSELHSVLDLLLYYLNRDYRLKPVSHPSFLEGRVGRIGTNGFGVGYIGEVHPQVLEKWQIGMPCSAFELDLDRLIG